MSISGIPGGIGGISAGAAHTPVGAGANSREANDAFGGLLASLTGAQQAADKAVGDIAVGGEHDLHDAVLSVQMESLTFDLAVQIRNRLVDAYQEMFRMSV
jgi:flagellar hook-basal body complex protein FliE